MKKIQTLVRLFNYSQHNYQRKPFSCLEPRDIEYFRTVMAQRNVVTDIDTIEPHNLCFRKSIKGQSTLLLLPQNTQEVSAILKYCNERKLAVVPQGGNTGLVGGSVPIFDEIILNLKNMNRIQKLDEVSSVVSVEAGVILERLMGFLQGQGFEMPLDLGAKGSCQVGGNASTNAGGKYVIKYGSFRSHILGLEVVLPNGQVLDLCSEIYKDNTGYDLKQLFIGSQGTLGVITKLNIHCPKADKFRKVMVFKTDKYQNILKSIPKLKQYFGKKLNALQCIDQSCFSAVTTKLHKPIFDRVEPNQYLLFVQISTDDIQNLLEVLPEFNDAIMSNNDKQFQQIWKIREDVSIAARMCGRVQAYDISFQVSQWFNLIKQLRAKTQKPVMGFGHIGDGNLHVNIILKQGENVQDLNVFEEVIKKKGSISAEHGIGSHKPKYLHLQKSPSVINIYRGLKNLFDPVGIMNPYKVIPE